MFKIDVITTKDIMLFLDVSRKKFIFDNEASLKKVPKKFLR